MRLLRSMATRNLPGFLRKYIKVPLGKKDQWGITRGLSQRFEEVHGYNISRLT